MGLRKKFPIRKSGRASHRREMRFRRAAHAIHAIGRRVGHDRGRLPRHEEETDAFLRLMRSANGDCTASGGISFSGNGIAIEAGVEAGARYKRYDRDLFGCSKNGRYIVGWRCGGPRR
jgi:hypothetical protein